LPKVQVLDQDSSGSETPMFMKLSAPLQQLYRHIGDVVPHSLLYPRGVRGQIFGWRLRRVQPARASSSPSRRDLHIIEWQGHLRQHRALGQPRTPSTTTIFKFLLEELAGEHRELQTLFVAAVMKGPPLPSPIGVGKCTLLPSTPPPSASRAIPEGTSLLLALFCSQV
jgi:hypothetical protein